MNNLIAVTALSSILVSGQASAWDEYSRHNHTSYNSHDRYNYSHHDSHHRNDDAAVALVGGLILGAAIANSTQNSRYNSSTTYYSDFPSHTTSTIYYPESYYIKPHDNEQVYVTQPVVHTTYYSQPVTRTYSAPRYNYPKSKPVERVYYGETLRDEHGNCYRIEYHNSRKILNKVPRYQCSED
jgi:hypothetical protein